VDLLDLKQLRIETERHKWARRRILVGESVNGVTGVSQALSEVELICNELRIGVVWDDSFALGGYGMRGVPESSDCVWSPSRLLRLAALNRFAAGLGCLVAGPKVLMDTLAVRSHFIQSEIPLPSFVASVGTSILDALELKVGDRERIRLLWTRVGAAVQSLGWVVLGEAPGPLLSFRVESRRLAEEIREALLSKFVLVDALPAPDSDASGGIVRIILAAHHDERAVGALLNSLVEVRPRLEV
jgi:7-keto-8-aminopelargonate synthetase-like enzyme